MHRCRALALGALAISMLLFASPAAAAQHKPKRPNVLVIITDDQRADGTLDVMPQTRRWFERNGTTFTNGFVTTPLCCPARASLFTGNYAHNHYAFVNDINRTAAPFAHSRELQRYLHRGGYRTGIVGKYFNGFPLERKPPYFDDYAVHEAFYYRSRWNVQGRVTNDVRTYSTTYTRNRARELIRKYGKQEKPWFLYVATNAPHGPLTVERRYRGTDAGPDPSDPAVNETDLSDKPPWIGRLDQGRDFAFSVRRDQRRILRSADDMVGGIMDELRRTGQAGDTLAIFTSDNGLFWGEHGGLAIKDLPYDPATKVPFLMRWPRGDVRRRAKDDRLAANVDIAPTIYDATGVKGPPTDGWTLLGGHRRDRLLLEYGGLTNLIPAWATLRMPGSEYSEYYGFPGDRPHSLPSGASLEQRDDASFLEYYDLVADPFQVDNIASRRTPPVPAELAPLARQLHADMDCRGRSCP